MRGQTTVVSIVILAGIIITLVGAAYMWSVPLLNKGETQTTFQTALDFAMGLNQKIVDMANTGGGEESLDIPLGSVKVVPYNSSDPRNNSIMLQFLVSQPLAFNSSKTYLGGASFLDVTDPSTGIFGESQPSIISLEVEPLGTGYVATIQILFRKLVTKTAPVKTREIVLNSDSPDQILTGKNKITFAFDRNIQDGQTTLTNIIVMLV
jgi:hypothetical protein